VTGYDRFRWLAVALLVAAAILSVFGNDHRSPVLRALALGCFLAAAFAFTAWRRAARADRARVFDREAKTSDETRTGPDQ
jgi:hypothetical protein